MTLSTRAPRCGPNSGDMTKKRRPAKPVGSGPRRIEWRAAVTDPVVMLAMSSYACLSALAAAGVDVETAAAAIVVVLLAVSKVCTKLRLQ